MLNNRDFEFKQLLRAYRADIVTEATFESELGAMEGGNGNGAGNGRHEFEATGKTFSSERQAADAMLDRFRAGEANGEAAFWHGLSRVPPTASAAEPG